MTKKDLFRLTIKVLGLYFLVSAVMGALSTITTLTLNWKLFIGTGSIVGNFVVLILLSIFLIYEPDKIINWLKLDKNFDNSQVELQKLNFENLLKLTIIVIGGVLILKNISTILNSLFTVFKISFGNTIWSPTLSFNQILPKLINVLIGYLMLTNYTDISHFIIKKGKTEK